MLKVAIIGCGKIADAHASQVQRIKNCEIVAVCDREELMAKQLYERFPIKAYFADVAEMLEKARPDVVHITTPPQGHFPLGKQCLEHGCHVYIEKPFALDTAEAIELIETAQKKKVKITAGHDDQFSPVAQRMRTAVRGGYLGGEPVHMESYYCYDLADPGYAKAFLGNKNHWVRKLPGKLLQNIISHGLARIAEFFPDENPEVMARGFVSPRLRALGEDEIVDELRVLILGREGHTAYFTFSSQMRPSLHQFRLYGPKNGLVMDEDHQTLIRLKGKRLKSYAERFIPPADLAKQEMKNLAGNVRKFLANDFHMKSGMKNLIESFYRSITEGTALPIAYREILLVSRIMDAIFEQIGPKKDKGTTAPSFRENRAEFVANRTGN